MSLRILCPFLWMMLVPWTTFCQESRWMAVVDSILHTVRRTSVYTDKVDWAELSIQIRSRVAGAKTVEELGPAMMYLLEQLGDEHGRIFYNDQVMAYYYSGQLKPHQAHFDSGLYSEIQNTHTYPFLTKMVDAKTGYVRLPGLPMGDNLQMAREIRDAICELIRNGAEQWIIDLRYNGGGNLNPMVAGLSPLLEDGPLGGATGATSGQHVEWIMRDGQFFNHGYTVGLEKTCETDRLPRIAVLTSLYTASSGEALAIIFKGVPHTRFFGERTLGMVTGTGWEMVGPGIVLAISVNHFRDRTGHIYTAYVDVDETIPFAPIADTTQDPAIVRAIAWLNAR